MSVQPKHPSATDSVDVAHPQANKKTKACVCLFSQLAMRMLTSVLSGPPLQCRWADCPAPGLTGRRRPPLQETYVKSVGFEVEPECRVADLPPHLPAAAPEPTWPVSLSITTRVSRAGITTANKRFEKALPQNREELIRQIRECRFIDPLSSCAPDEARGGTVLGHSIKVTRRPQEGVLKEPAQRETGERILRVSPTSPAASAYLTQKILTLCMLAG